MIYVVLLLFSFTLAYFIKNYYIKNAILDEINERSSHTVATPHGGGIAIAITWFIGLIYLYMYNQIDVILFFALMIGIIISVVSFFDDIYELSARFRLLIQAGVAIVAIVALGGFDSLEFGLFNCQNQIITNIHHIFTFRVFI